MENENEKEEILDVQEKDSSDKVIEEIKAMEQSKMANTMTSDWKELSKSGNLKSSKKGLKVLIAVIILLLLVAGGVFAYFKFLKPDAEMVFTKLIKGYTSEITKVVDNSLDKNSSSYVRTGNFTFNTDMTDYKIFNGISLDYTLGMDFNSKVMSADFTYKEQDKNILAGNLYLKDKKIYLKSDQVYDKLLYLAETDEDFFADAFSKQDIEDMKYIFKQGSIYLQNSLKKATYKTEAGSLIINGKDTKIQKNIMVIDKSNANTIGDTLLASMKNDSMFMDALKRLSDDDNSSSKLEETIKVDSSDNFEPIAIEIDTKGITNQVVGLKLTEGASTLLNMVASSNKTYDFTLGQELKGTLTVNNSNDIAIDTKVEGYNVNVGLITTKSLDSYNLTVKVTDPSGKYVNASIKNNATNKTIPVLSIDKAVNVETMDNSEQEKLQTNLLKVFNSSKVLSTLSQYLE